MSKIQIAPKYSEVKPQGFYVYVHKRAVNGLPFYVGKGCYKRGWSLARGKMWKNIARKNGVLIEIISENMSESDALNLEDSVIDEIGIENLCNIMTGGYLSVQADRCKAVYCSNGNKFKSISDASRWVSENTKYIGNVAKISNCVNGFTKTAYGFIWSFQDTVFPEYISPKHRSATTRGKMVVSSCGEIFETCGQAAMYLRSKGLPKATQSAISRSATYGTTAYGAHWTFVKSLDSILEML